MPKVEVNGAQLYYELKGEGEPVLLVHSAMSDHEEWKYQIPELSKSLRVITCDLRGHGDSSKEEPDKFSVELFADDLEGLTNQLGLSKVHLVGHSMGGEVACYFAARHPQRLKTLVLMGEPSGPPSTFMIRAASLLDRFLSPERLARMGASRMLYNVTEEKIEMAVRMYTKAGRATASGDSKVVNRFQLPRELPSLSVPTLLVYGETDIAKKHSEKVHAAIPWSKLVIIPRAGHAMQLDNPEELNRVLLEFLLSHKQGS